VALLSHSIFGSSSGRRRAHARGARAAGAQSAPELAVIGEVHGDAALSEDIRASTSRGGFAGSANLLVMPSLDAANILFNVLKVSSGKGVTVGPILLGAAKPVHILSPSATVRRIVNMTALAVAGVLGAWAELHAFPQRSMGHHVEIHRHARRRDALQQADVGRPAGLRQDGVLGAEVVGELRLEPVLGAAGLQEHRRHQGLSAVCRCRQSTWARTRSARSQCISNRSRPT
jgi:hypothetical protein